jgi:hypothetical protein
MDLNIGRILERLERLGLRQNTLVIFSSDNGFSCGHHGFWLKGNGTFPLNMYENSVKVPAIFSQPGLLPQGAVSPALVSQYDFMPTLLDYLQLPPAGDSTLPGRSFLPVLQGHTNQSAQHVVVYDEYGPVRMIRTPEWKYVHRFPYGPHEISRMKNRVPVLLRRCASGLPHGLNNTWTRSATAPAPQFPAKDSRTESIPSTRLNPPLNARPKRHDPEPVPDSNRRRLSPHTLQKPAIRAINPVFDLKNAVFESIPMAGFLIRPPKTAITTRHPHPHRSPAVIVTGEADEGVPGVE